MPFPEMVWMGVGADLLTALSYYLLFFGLIYFVRKRPDLTYRSVFFLLGLFLFYAGTLPLSRIWTEWQGHPEVEVVLKCLTALLSFLVVAFLWRLMRQALTLPSPVNLLPTIIQAIRETREVPSALEVALGKVCGATDWDYGEAWVPAEDGRVLEASPAWYGAPVFEEFRRLSQELKFSPDAGLPGRIWTSRHPEWVRRVPDRANGVFSRTQMAKAGFKTALGIPVIADNRVAAVLVFFTRESRPRDIRMIGLVSTVAAQLGSVIERNRAEETLRESNEQEERRFQERTKALAKEKERLQQEVGAIKQAEESLRRSQEDYQALVDSIGGIVWGFDLKTSKFFLVSQQAEQMLGYPVEAWLTEPTFWQDHIHGGDRDSAIAFRNRVIQDKTDDQFEYRMISADGHARWFRDMVTVVIENGRATKLRGTMVDITEQKLVEEALSQERNYTAAVLDTSGALVIILDPAGRIVRFNSTCEKTSGYSEIKGKHFWDLFSLPQNGDKMKAIFNRLLAGQFPIEYESEWVTKDGNRQVTAWSQTVLFNKENVPVNVIATGIDITKRKEVEKKLTEAVGDLARSNKELDRSSRELSEANERLKKLDELKSQFISAASHELKTPLTSMEGYLEILLQEEGGALNGQQKEFLGYVKQSTDRLHRLLIELLDISKIESGQVKMNKERTNIRDLLKEEIMIFKAQADGKEISLGLETGPELQEIYCDADKLREVVDNLVSNAVKYTPRGGKVKIAAVPQEKGIRIEVQDTGIGLKAEDIARIFEPFQHIEKNGAEEEEESTGLGLTLVKKIIEAHEGEIAVKSQEGKGSTFTVILPTGNPQRPREKLYGVTHE